MHINNETDFDRLLATKAVSDLCNVCPRTIYRWEQDDELDFPKPIVIRGRKYRREKDLLQWREKRVQVQSVKQSGLKTEGAS